MNFQQLKIIRETVKRDYNLTEVGNALFTSQSGVSKHIKDLEDELGIEIFVRKGKRLLGLTDAGKELLIIVERILLDAKNIKQFSAQFSKRDEGQLTIATTHTQARYALPRVIKEFKTIFPKVHLVLHQSSPDEIASMISDGQADIAIATEALDQIQGIVHFPYYNWHHAIVVPNSHPLTNQNKITLEDVAMYPIITYHKGFTGRKKIDDSFSKAGLNPEIIMSALDADVIKSYVELGLGVGIIASMAYIKNKDTELTLLESVHLFESNTTRIAIKRGHYLRDYAYQFIQLCSQELNKEIIKSTLEPNLDYDD